MKYSNFRSYCGLSVLLLFVFALSPLSAAMPPIEVSGIPKFTDGFKDRDYWLRMEIELVAHPTSRSNPENPNFLKNVTMKVILVYDNRTKSKSVQKYVFFKAFAKFSMMEKGERMKMYYYLPSDVIKYYRLGKRPKYFLLSFNVNGTDVPVHKAFYSSKFDPKWMEVFMGEVAKYEGQTAGMLLPIHLAPPYVTGGADFKALPSFSRKDLEE